MNDSQYLSHGATIVHSGVKGMKWGKHIKRTVDKFVDEKITGKSAQAEADSYSRMAQHHQNAADDSRRTSSAYSNRAAGYEEDAKKATSRAQGRNTYTGLYTTHDGKIGSYNNTSVGGRAEQYRVADKANKNATTAHAAANQSNVRAWRAEQEAQRNRAKAASAQRKANQSLFGRARLIFGNPKKKAGGK